jgi:2-polyprenyl-3-methyl-5-hydroxy-6-metoxy-1,4-benzoquinol methylase
MSIVDEFAEAVAMIREKKLGEAAQRFLQFERQPELAPFCYYHLAQIANMTGEPELSYALYYKAFENKPDLAGAMLAQNHPSNSYVFRGLNEEDEFTDCPLCGKPGAPYWTYPLTEMADYSPAFNPIRLWMRCGDCNHLFARHFPKEPPMEDGESRNVSTNLFGYYSSLLRRLRQYTEGTTLFEVGIGGGECLLAAREIGYRCAGLDVVPGFVRKARDLYGLDVESCDFVEYETEQKWDVLIMGDVLEHVSDPILAIEKAASILMEDGVLWISTPNYESAFSRVVGHDDPMRREPYHVNYFSRESLYLLLERAGLEPVDYHISQHYNGSMEIIAVKSSRFEESPERGSED